MTDTTLERCANRVETLYFEERGCVLPNARCDDGVCTCHDFACIAAKAVITELMKPSDGVLNAVFNEADMKSERIKTYRYFNELLMQKMLQAVLDGK